MDNPAPHSQTSPAPPNGSPFDSADLTGRTLDDFRIQRLLGRGGMGHVYLAEQLSLKRPVALKIMRADLAANAVAVARFQAEAEAVARVPHANIVQVYAVGIAEGLHFMALEYVEGRNLRDYLAKKGPPELPAALSLIRQAAAGLQRAHEAGIVHRDIKPENMLLTRKGELKVADFGLSRCLAPDQQPLNLTQTGMAMGTPLYMSPEQVRGTPADPRSDIYSFGVTCYHLLAGEPPFRGQTSFEVALQHVQKEPRPLGDIRPDLPPELCEIVHRMMAKAPDDRYQTCRDLIKDLVALREVLGGAGQTQAVVQSRPVPKPARSTTMKTTAPAVAARPASWGSWVLFAVVLVLAAAAGVGARYRDDSQPKLPSTPTFKEPEAEPSFAARREKELLAAFRQEVDPKQKPEDEIKRHLRAAVRLGAFYLEQRKLTDATAFFKMLIDKPLLAPPASGILGRYGLAATLAFQDQPAASVSQFLDALEAEKAHPAEKMLSTNPLLRELLAEALTRDAANLGGKPLPEPLENLRKIMTPAPHRP
jgi:serine/threonine-protein kinase